MVSLRYSFGGDRPSQTALLTMSVHSPCTLVNQYNKGGISTTAPPTLACQTLSLPPILHILHQFTMPGCSKGSRGLSVRSRVSGIFTATSISPSPWLRQRPSRYTIRAGRNLPDKEFRYLRTVIVTAAVYRGFISKLLPHQLYALNFPASLLTQKALRAQRYANGFNRLIANAKGILNQLPLRLLRLLP